MHKPRPFFIFSIVFALILTGALTVSAQETPSATQPVNAIQPAQPNHEIVLQLLVASNDASEKTGVPQNLNPVVRKLKTDLGLSNYRLALTLLNRVAAKSGVEIKGVSHSNQPYADKKSLNFYELTLNTDGVRPNQSGNSEMQIATLRFGMRIPVITASLVQDDKSSPVINYENIGIMARSLSLAFNEPTVVGAFTTSNPNEMFVLVLTVKPEAETRQIAGKK